MNDTKVIPTGQVKVRPSNGHPPEEDWPGWEPKYLEPIDPPFMQPLPEIPADWDFSPPPEPPHQPPSTPAEKEFNARRRARKLHLLSIEDVEEKEIGWLWPRWLPHGFAWLEGDPGTSKSMFATLLAAIATTPRPFPGDSDPRLPVNVLYLSSGEDPDSVIKQRFRNCGGNLKRMFVLDVKKIMSDPQAGNAAGLPTLPDDAPLLLEAAHECQAKFVVLDAGFSFISSEEDIFNDHEFRAAIEPFARAVSEAGLVALGLRHFTKIRQSTANQGIGAVAGTAVARSVLVMNLEPGAPSHRLLGCSKLSYGARPEGSLIFDIQAEGPIATAWLTYTGPSGVSVGSSTAMARNPKVAEAHIFFGRLKDAFTTALAATNLPLEALDGYEQSVDSVARGVGYSGENFPNSTPGRRLKKELSVKSLKVKDKSFWALKLD